MFFKKSFLKASQNLFSPYRLCPPSVSHHPAVGWNKMGRVTSPIIFPEYPFCSTQKTRTEKGRTRILFWNKMGGVTHDFQPHFIPQVYKKIEKSVSKKNVPDTRNHKNGVGSRIFQGILWGLPHAFYSRRRRGDHI